MRQILNVTSLRDFERFIRLLASRSTSMLNKSDVARDVGISVKAVDDWLSVLQTSGQTILLEPWFVNFGKRIVKTPKLYFRDSGLLCFLLNLSETTLSALPVLGAVWETFLFAEMRKLNSILPQPVNFWYYRDQRAREIDFVIESAGRLTFVECNWQEHPRKDDARHILAVHEELARSATSWRPGRHYVVGTPSSTPLSSARSRVVSLQALFETFPGSSRGKSGFQCINSRYCVCRPSCWPNGAPEPRSMVRSASPRGRSALKKDYRAFRKGLRLYHKTNEEPEEICPWMAAEA